MWRSLILALAFTMSSLIFPAYAGESLKDIIQARENVWAAAYNAHDSAALGAIYEEDAALIPPGMKPVHGRPAIEEALAGFFPVLKDLRLDTDNVRPMGEDYAVEIGRVSYKAVGEDRSLTPVTDDFVVVWNRGEDGIWRYQTDIFNSR